MKIEPGAVVCEGIRLSRVLAEGGMGSVWLAENVHLGAPVSDARAPCSVKSPSG